MNTESKRLAYLSESATVAMNQKTRDLQAKGINVINLSVGEPDFNTPEHIKEAAKKAIDDNFSFYPPVNGYPELLQAISEKLKRENGLNYPPSQIMVSVGAKHSLANTVLAVINPGDEVIIPTPYWVTYSELVKLAEGIPVYIKSTIENHFKVSPKQIEKVITPKTKALMICSPSNPSGAVYSKEELKSIAEVIEKHNNILVISDEIYEHINFVGKHESIAQFENIKDRVILINGVSKAYAMTGYRVGFIAGPAWIVKACSKLQGQFTTSTASVSMKAALAAYNGDQSCLTELNRTFIRRKNLIIEKLKEIPGLNLFEPQGAFYIFPDVSSYYGKSDGNTIINNSTDMCLFLLDKAHISPVPGEAFGEPTCIRISFATSDENIIEAMFRMKKALETLK